MREDAHLWKFWVWELVMGWVLASGGLAVLLYLPNVAEIVQAQRVEIQIFGGVLLLVVATALAYRIATGTFAGLAKWCIWLVGSGSIVGVLVVLPLVFFNYLVKPEYLGPTSPFVALFALWCLYGIVFLIKWQTRLFYGVKSAGENR